MTKQIESLNALCCNEKTEPVYFESSNKTSKGYVKVNGFIHTIQKSGTKTKILITDNSQAVVKTDIYKQSDMISRIRFVFAANPTNVYGLTTDNVLENDTVVKISEIQEKNNEKFFTLEKVDQDQKIQCLVTTKNITIKKFKNGIVSPINNDEKEITIPIKDIEKELLGKYRQFAKSEPRLHQTMVSLGKIIRQETRLLNKIKERLTENISE